MFMTSAINSTILYNFERCNKLTKMEFGKKFKCIISIDNISVHSFANFLLLKTCYISQKQRDVLKQ